MLQVGTLNFMVTGDKKSLRLKVDGRLFGLESETTPGDLLRVAQYLTEEAERSRGANAARSRGRDD